MFCSDNGKLSAGMIALLLCSCLPVSADESAPKSGGTAQSQTGKVEFNSQVPEPSFRIKREPVKPKLFGTVEKNTSIMPRPYVNAEPALDSVVKANDYTGIVQNSLNAGAVTTENKSPKGNYTWGQSADGGYFDATGQIKELIMGDQLYKFGGKFVDGTAVPTTPVVCNFRGHVYKPYVVKRIP